MMYDEIVKRLHRCAAEAAVVTDAELMIVAREAADAIEELQKRVPKRPHGRLIDADAMGMNYLHIRDDGMKIYTQRAIDNAPTIIQADHFGDTTEMVKAEEGE